MNVKLVGITEPKIEGITSSENIISFCARVSNSSNQFNDGGKLIRYCIKNKHWSIFEMVNVVMEIYVTRDIARQILRHSSFSFMEFSQRYADPIKELNFVLREARLQDTKDRQNSIEFEDNELKIEWEIKQTNLIAEAKKTYEWAIENGIAKEQARVVLPEGNIMSKLYMNGNLRSWITFIALREKKATQKEHREVALKCKRIICEAFPSIADALGNIEKDWIL